MNLHEALARPESYPHRPDTVEVRETHISWVFLAGELVYKLKKPLVLDFLDYGTPERRREMCREEVRLNRRLAPDIYLGVRGVREVREVRGVRGVASTADGVELTAEDDPRAIDYMVEMRRFDERRTVAARLERGELDRGEVEAVGRMLARFHESAPSVKPAADPVMAVERRFERNLHELLNAADQRGEIARTLGLERFAHTFVTAYARTFQIRSDRGLIREGHGDLRAEHVLIAPQVEVVDCVEFDRELRELDVADEVAFLMFDLVSQGAEHFAGPLVRSYREAGGDPGQDQLIAFFAAYRALVRAKVELVRAAQRPPASDAHGRASAVARDLVLLAERFAWRARLPLAIVTCGVPASGKSYLARELAELSGLPHLSSDLTRKQLRGLPPTHRAGAQAYSAQWNARTYGELGRRAAREVRGRGGVIVDGTFRHLADREAFASTFDQAAPLLFVECQAPRAVLALRAAGRERDPERVPDADAAVVRREAASWEPLDEVPASGHVALRTDRELREIVDDLLALLDRRRWELA